MSETTDRFARTRLLLGKEKLSRLHKAKVTVIGLGAVGGHVVEALARSGVGSFRLVDFDQIRPSNVNRHIWATDATIGRSKALVGMERVLSINPDIHVEALEMFAAVDTLDRILDDKPDIVIDAIDSLNPKVQVLAGCHARKVLVLSSMGAATRTDPFKIKVGDIMDTKSCPLASHVRSRLKSQGITKGIQCVYSEESRNRNAIAPDLIRDVGEFDRGRKRLSMGSLPTITGIFGLVLANLALEHLVKGLRKPS